ncbi:hypothetical protein G9A89_009359 [Geosiphon pyriformis]|nr:hypothetical protein G9A89_009359 [Geosiphon pyriformis]
MLFETDSRKFDLFLFGHGHSKITFSFADYKINDMQTLLKTSWQLYTVVQFPDVFGAWVAANYYHRWRKYLETKFFRRLQKESKFSNFEFTGFGESSPYAIFAALAFLKKYKQEERPIVVTFGQPRMGNEIFVAYARSKLKIYRVTLEDDWLPNLPLRGIRKFSKWDDESERPSNLPTIYEEYKHFQPEFWIELQKNLVSQEMFCECPQSASSLVYECYNTHSLDEHPVQSSKYLIFSENDKCLRLTFNQFLGMQCS